MCMFHLCKCMCARMRVRACACLYVFVNLLMRNTHMHTHFIIRTEYHWIGIQQLYSSFVSLIRKRLLTTPFQWGCFVDVSFLCLFIFTFLLYVFLSFKQICKSAHWDDPPAENFWTTQPLCTAQCHKILYVEFEWLKTVSVGFIFDFALFMESWGKKATLTVGEVDRDNLFLMREKHRKEALY